MKIVAVLDSDQTFAERFMEYVNRKTEVGVRLVSFSTLTALENYLLMESPDGIMTDLVEDLEASEICQKATESKRIQRIYIGAVKDGPRIYKYQSADVILQLILKLLQEKSQRVERVGCYGVFSPIGRCGCTRFAKALTQLSGGVYVGMENYSEGVGIASDLYFLAKTNSPDLRETVKRSIYVSEDMRMLVLSPTYVDGRHANKKDIEKIRDAILASGETDTVVFDIGSGALSDFSILSCFERLYLPVLEDQVSQRKLECFQRNLEEMNQTELLAGARRIHVPEDEQELMEMVKGLRD